MFFLLIYFLGAIATFIGVMYKYGKDEKSSDADTFDYMGKAIPIAMIWFISIPIIIGMLIGIWAYDQGMNNK